MPASLVATRRLDWLKNQREAAVSEITTLAERAADDDRDLTDAEDASVTRKRAEVTRLDDQITVELEACERQAKYEDVAQRVGPAIARSADVSTISFPRPTEPEMAYRSAGEYLGDFLKARKDRDCEAAGRLERFRSTLQRANQTLDQNPGIVPTPVIGPVIQTIDARRPAVDAATKRPMPAGGKSFTRPIVASHTAVGVQATEKTALPSAPLVVNELTVEKVTYGGAINLSWQDRDWTEPAILDLLIGDMTAAYAAATDAAFCSALEAAVTQSVTATTGATPAASDSASWLTAIYEAAALVFGSGNAVPNTLWLAPDRWAALGALVDGSGRPLFPVAGPQNTLGDITAGLQAGSVAGMRLAVDSYLTAGSAILGDSQGVEFFEQVGGTVSALEPTILGTAIAYYGYAATAVIRPDTFVSIVSA